VQQPHQSVYRLINNHNSAYDSHHSSCQYSNLQDCLFCYLYSSYHCNNHTSQSTASSTITTDIITATKAEQQLLSQHPLFQLISLSRNLVIKADFTTAPTTPDTKTATTAAVKIATTMTAYFAML
jgi:hypothetical protein